MKGLVLKDIYLLAKRKRIILLFFVISVMLGASNGSSFMVGYLTFIGAITSVSTIAYDDYDNGMSFLMTLPVKRETYALSKYLSGFGVTVVTWLFGLIMMMALNVVGGKEILLIEDIFGSAAILLVAFLMIDLTIPLNLKYGSEQGRMVTFIFAGVITLAIVVISKMPALSATIVKLGELLAATSEPTTILLTIILLVAANFCSLMASYKIMRKKTF